MSNSYLSEKSSTQSHSISFRLEADTPTKLVSLCGASNEHLKQIEKHLSIRILNRGHVFQLKGAFELVRQAEILIKQLYLEVEQGTEITPDKVHLLLMASGSQQSEVLPSQGLYEDKLYAIETTKLTVKPRGVNQKRYVHHIINHDINFGIGPAGTGKTYLAVACAVRALLKDDVRRILLVRPAVEAGEKLGFLPGDLSQKVDPYLRPLYDALYEMLGFEKVDRLIERNMIEVAPLAFMRGRTLSHSFIILDESQNTTCEQMKMFLTRIGFGSTAIITGDPTQIDLPRGQKSGLIQALDILQKVKGISFTHFEVGDVVRHPLVQRIVEAYEIDHGA